MLRPLPPSPSYRPIATTTSGSTPESHSRPAAPDSSPSADPAQLSGPQHVFARGSVAPLAESALQRLTSALQPTGKPTTVPLSTAPVDGHQLSSGASRSGGAALSSQAPPTRTVYLKTGPVVFTERDVPDPPAFNAQLRGPMDKVLGNILKWWDDTRPEWDPECSLLKLNIDGKKVGIPGVLWKELYAFPWRSNQWAGLKGRYSELSCLIRDYDRLTAEGRTDDFWAPMMMRNKAGKLAVMRYTKAVAALRLQRQQVMQEHAEELLRDTDHAQVFSYSRGGKAIGMRNATAVVKRAQKMGILASLRL